MKDGFRPAPKEREPRFARVRIPVSQKHVAQKHVAQKHVVQKHVAQKHVAHKKEAPVREPLWLGYMDSNHDYRYQKPMSCH
jgi:hypothetical protein